MIASILVAVVLLLAYANGANDNLKGVATLLGSRTVDYRRASQWATFCTLLGSLISVVMAAELLKAFTGKGLVGDELAQLPQFAAAVGCGAGLTVLLATRFALPISTTHGLVGALVGAGLAAGGPIDVSRLATAFFVPLLVSPFLALFTTALVYPILSWCRAKSGVTSDTCVCVESAVLAPALNGVAAAQVAMHVEPYLKFGTTSTCSGYNGTIWGWQARSVLDALHFISGGLLSFARALNDTPKIAAVMLVGTALPGEWSLVVVGIAIAVGGLLRGRQVAETMSQRITEMNPGQGFTANAVSALIVIAASGWGLPVSTTHVTCGSLFGIGTVTGRAQWKTIAGITGAWLFTLPCGAVLGFVAYFVMEALVA